MQKGRFFAIESIVNSWPRTLTKIMAGRLQSEGCSVAVINFPDLSSPGAFMVKKMLEDCEDVDWSPRPAALAYTIERLNSDAKIRELLGRRTIILESGSFIATLMHQGGKVPSTRREEFFRFVEDYERQHVLLPDIIFLLDISPDSHDILDNIAFSNRREKLFDREEDSLAHILRSIESIDHYARLYPHRLYRVQAVENGMPYQLHSLSEKLLQLIKERL